MSGWRRFLIIIILLTVFISGLAYFSKKVEEENLNKKVEFGVTFSKKRAESFDLDWRETYLAILKDLEVKKIRLGAYWDEIEKNWGEYNFETLDWQIERAEKKDVEIILVIGQRLPGWPECHWPSWVKDLPKEEREDSLIVFLRKIIERYKGKSVIKAWQLENEPFLRGFGLCPPLNKEFFEREINLLKSLDNRPIIISESGELSTWLSASRYADILGVTMYRIVWNKYFKYFIYPYPAGFYFLKGEIVKFLTGVKKIICVELQAEPWANKSLTEIPLLEQYKVMDAQKFKEIIDFAQKAGFSENYLWGVEWWYWLKDKGDASLWEAAKVLWQ